MHVLMVVLIAMMTSQTMLFDFSKENQESWNIVDDVVMGGRSSGSFAINKKGHGVFSGSVSLENNGGFSSLRSRFEPLDVEKFKTIKVRLRGDGKKYQFRVKSSAYERHSYITYFETTGNWQTIEFDLSKMYPSYRGIRLQMPNYPGKLLAEVTFLISNKKEEEFELELDYLALE